MSIILFTQNLSDLFDVSWEIVTSTVTDVKALTLGLFYMTSLVKKKKKCNRNMPVWAIGTSNDFLFK